MANRYWVGGGGTWSSTDTSHWSTSTGGTPGASVPGTNDIAIFDNSSAFAERIILNYDLDITAINISTFTGVLDFNDKNITLGSLISTSSSTSNKFLYLGSGTLSFDSRYSTQKILFSITSLFTLYCETSTIKIIDKTGSTCSMVLGSFSYYNIWLDRGSADGWSEFYGTFFVKNFKSTPTGISHIKIGTSSVINIERIFDVNGLVNKLTYIFATSGTGYLNYLNSYNDPLLYRISCNYLSITNIHVNPIDIWHAIHSTDGGNNTGWLFNGNELTLPSAIPLSVSSNTAIIQTEELKANIISYYSMEYGSKNIIET